MRTAQLRRRRLPDPVVGAFDAHNPADFAAMKAAGFTHALIEYRWDEAQPNGPLTPLDPATITLITTRIANARAAGLKVQFQIAFHYVPAWVDAPGSYIPKFKNQHGQEWSETTSGGRNIRDWYFSATGRAYLADFIQRCLATLDLAQIDTMRTGPGWYGENNYPPSPDLNTFHWWAYGTAPQTGVDLAAGMDVCPTPGYVPFSGDSGKDTQFTEWYLDSLATVLDWLIKLHRTSGWLRDVFILLPGFGIRDTFAYGSADYQRQACVGSDWERQVAVFAHMPSVHMQCTWIDGIHPFATDLTVKSNQAAWYRLLEIAQDSGKSKRIAGENTAINWTYLDEDRVFQLDALAQGYRDMWFLTYPSLAAASSPVVDLPHTAANITYLRNKAAPKPVLLSPTTVSTPLLYLTANTGVVSSSNAVTQWNDQSGQGNNSIVASGAMRPTLHPTGGPNNQSYLAFNGTSNYLTFASAPFNLAMYTIFILARVHTSGAFMGKVGGAAGQTLRKLEMGMSPGGQLYTRAGSDTEYNEAYTSNSMLGAWHLFSTTMRAGNDFDMNIDGANQTRNVADGTINFSFFPTPFNNELLALGREGAFGGYSQVDIASVMIAGSALDVAARQRVETYFRLAYGVF
jgi:hypothetical protein